MHTINQMKTRFGRVFNTEQAEVLSEVINDAYTDLVKTSDFNELKEIVRDIGVKVGELAEAQNRTETRVEELVEAQKRTETRVEELTEAQKRTETRVEELTEAQKRTETRVEELAEAQKRTEIVLQNLVIEHQDTRQQLGGLAQSVGYGLEDKIMPYMLDFVKKNYGMEAKIVERRNIVYPDGRFDELNIYVEGARNGQKVFAVGECKAKPGKKDADKFHKVIERVGTVLAGEIFPFLVGFGFDPEVENYIRENYPQTGMFKSYEFELKYQRSVLQF
jgi:vacuolar-type H+-ATPase subunit I/STV1